MFANLIDATRRLRSPGTVREALSRYRANYPSDPRMSSDLEHVDKIVTFYDLVTDYYEYGWGQSFHFAVMRPGDTLPQAIERHESWIGYEIGLRPGIRALDLGCGVGGPMRYLARTTGAHITGVNLNATQVDRARQRARSAGLADQITVELADFAELPFADESFDAVFAIEATSHAPDRRNAFAEALRVLKPGGRFAGYERCTTARFDPQSEQHIAIARAIEEGNALPPLRPTKAIDEALRAVGFELLGTRDVAMDCHPDTPWWSTLLGRGGLRSLPRTSFGRSATSVLLPTLERLRIAPQGATELSDLLHRSADALVEGGRLGIFTPMYRWSAIRFA